MELKYVFTNEIMKELFGSEKDEHGRLYQGVYRNEFDDIECHIKDVKEIFSEDELTVIVKYLLYQCFYDTVDLDNSVCKRISRKVKE